MINFLTQDEYIIWLKGRKKRLMTNLTKSLTSGCDENELKDIYKEKVEFMVTYENDLKKFGITEETEK